MESWKKNLYVIWIAQFFAMIGMSMVIPFLPFYVRELGVTDQTELEMWSGLVFAGPFLLAFIMTPVWGALGDRFGKKAMVVRAIFGLALSQLLIGFADNVYQVLIFRMIQGGVSGFIAAALALVASISPKEKSGYAIGLLQTSIAAGTVIGPVVGGLLADFTSYSNIFFITATICALSGVMIVTSVKEGEIKITEKPFTVMQNVKFSFTNRKILLVLVSIMIVQIALMMPQPVFALFIETFEMETAYISTMTGTIFGTMGIFTVISSPWWGKRNDAQGVRKNILIAMTGAAIAMVLHSFVFSAFLLYPIRALLGFFIGGIVPAFYAYLNRSITSDRKGGIMGIASSFTLLGNFIGPLLCTAFTFRLNISWIFVISGFILFVNALIVYFNLRDFRKLRIDGKTEVVLKPVD